MTSHAHFATVLRLCNEGWQVLTPEVRAGDPMIFGGPSWVLSPTQDIGMVMGDGTLQVVKRATFETRPDFVLDSEGKTQAVQPDAHPKT
jgi:hypothetical protein